MYLNYGSSVWRSEIETFAFIVSDKGTFKKYFRDYGKTGESVIIQNSKGEASVSDRYRNELC